MLREGFMNWVRVTHRVEGCTNSSHDGASINRSRHPEVTNLRRHLVSEHHIAWLQVPTESHTCISTKTVDTEYTSCPLRLDTHRSLDLPPPSPNCHVYGHLPMNDTLLPFTRHLIEPAPPMKEGHGPECEVKVNPSCSARCSRFTWLCQR